MKSGKGRKRGRPRKAEKRSKPQSNGHELAQQTEDPKPEKFFQCDDCDFNTAWLAEITEHLSGTGHTGYTEVEPAEVQTDLFTEPAPITRTLQVAYSEQERRDLQDQITTSAMQRMEQTEIAENAKKAAKEHERQENKLLAELRHGSKLADVGCRWEVRMDENAKVLIRIDTGEVIEKKALSAEDRAREEKRAAAQNTEQAQEAAA